MKNKKLSRRKIIKQIGRYLKTGSHTMFGLDENGKVRSPTVVKGGRIDFSYKWFRVTCSAVHPYTGLNILPKDALEMLHDILVNENKKGFVPLSDIDL
jgi:hypothetical protein